MNWLRVLFLMTVLSVVVLFPLSAATEAPLVPDSIANESVATTVVSDFVVWFEDHMNYFTITLLMALESSFIPIPSELILGPAAFFASNPESDMNFFLVIIFATLGSVIGALIIYGLSAWVGRKALYKFADSRLGTFLMLDSDKIKHAEEVFKKRSKTSVCLGRFVAGIRLVISIPAGLAKMNLFNFVFFTFLGSAVYNTALALTGYLLHGQTNLISKYYHELSIAVIVLTILFVVFFIVRYFYLRLKRRKIYGLIGYPLEHSFSKQYFTRKFKKEKINAVYKLFELEDLDEIKKILRKKRLHGLNVTIPYKEKIIQYVDELDETARDIGAVNVLKIMRDKEKITIKGYNTDVIGFESTIKPAIKPEQKNALILGTGGVSKAIGYSLNRMGINTVFVSRTARPGMVDYNSLDKEMMNKNRIIVNATPLGTFPNVDEAPDIPYWYITPNHLLYDVVYNPPETLFLKKGKEMGAEIMNGENMLIGQAEAAWTIWNE